MTSHKVNNYQGDYEIFIEGSKKTFTHLPPQPPSTFDFNRMFSGRIIDSTNIQADVHKKLQYEISALGGSGEGGQFVF